MGGEGGEAWAVRGTPASTDGGGGEKKKNANYQSGNERDVTLCNRLVRVQGAEWSRKSNCEQTFLTLAVSESKRKKKCENKWMMTHAKAHKRSKNPPILAIQPPIHPFPLANISAIFRYSAHRT